MGMGKGVRMAAREAMMRLAYDPMDELVNIAQTAASPIVKQQIAEILLPYMYPKLSAVTVEAEVESKAVGVDQTELMQHILEHPELADAAQKIALAAAGLSMSAELDGYSGGRVQ
jgi:hypothetical protein